MSSKARNILVGITVLVAMGVGLWMILEFGTKSAGLFRPPQELVQIDAPRVDGLSEGSPLTYQGVVVGRITRLERNDDGKGVLISALLDTKPPVPKNIHADIIVTNLIGGAATVTLELNVVNGVEQNPQFLAEGESHPLMHAKYQGLKLDLLPGGTDNALAQISAAAGAIADFAKQIRQQQLVLHLDEAVQNINAKATQAGQVLDSIQKVIGNDQSQADLHQMIVDAHRTFDNLAKMSADLPRISQKAQDVLGEAQGTIQSAQSGIDDVHKQLSNTLLSASKMLDTVNELATKVNKGQGTAGLLVNDPKLYEALVDDLRQLNKDELTLARVMEQWEQEGISLKGLP
jgi:phospholipid/cholesterol/gamma-HCH transport system substrate-binding protein